MGNLVSQTWEIKTPLSSGETTYDGITYYLYNTENTSIILANTAALREAIPQNEALRFRVEELKVEKKASFWTGAGIGAAVATLLVTAVCSLFGH
jgi:hypothetical protein